jgi:hypothetical protein
MRFVIAVVVSFVSALVACGGGAASGEGPTAPGATPVASSQDPEGGNAGGTAQAGADCDFGGAESYTCSGALVCCYPEEGEVAYGACAETCPGYD